MIISRITTKAQTTIPREVREALSVSPGDALTYEILDDKVVIRKARPVDASYLRAVQATLSEWDSPEDAIFDDL